VVEGTQCLVLFKLRPEVMTPDNVHTNIFLSSMVDSPLDSLYYMIKSVFSPALRDNNNNKSNQAANQQVQTSLNELEQVLRSSGKKSSGSSSTSMANIFHPKDEIMYWYDIARSTSSKPNDLERAKYFLQLFDPVKGNFENLEK
jgi:dynein heavy chain 2